MTALDEGEMASALVGYQPISIAFEVVDDFVHYKDGVYTSTTCKNGPSGALLIIKRQEIAKCIVTKFSESATGSTLSYAFN